MNETLEDLHDLKYKVYYLVFFLFFVTQSMAAFCTSWGHCKQNQYLLGNINQMGNYKQ